MAVDRVAVAVDERDDFSLAGDSGCLLATGVDLALYGNQSRNFTTYRRHYAYEVSVSRAVRIVWRDPRTSMMHDVPRDFFHQLLERDVGELRWKDILNQVGIAFSDFVTYAQYWHRCL
jgi:hypothetical protein